MEKKMMDAIEVEELNMGDVFEDVKMEYVYKVDLFREVSHTVLLDAMKTINATGPRFDYNDELRESLEEILLTDVYAEEIDNMLWDIAYDALEKYLEKEGFQSKLSEYDYAYDILIDNALEYLKTNFQVSFDIMMDLG